MNPGRLLSPVLAAALMMLFGCTQTPSHASAAGQAIPTRSAGTVIMIIF
jgi:hypothetical protein